jgi:hypothetical protein
MRCYAYEAGGWEIQALQGRRAERWGLGWNRLESSKADSRRATPS